MKTLCLAFLLALSMANINEDFVSVLSGADELNEQLLTAMWDQFQSEVKVPEDSSEERREIFAANIRDIIQHNMDSDNQWQKGITAYTDMTEDEFADVSGGRHPTQCYSSAVEEEFDVDEESSALVGNHSNTPPVHYDWRYYHAVPPVKNQGHCGASYAFAAASVVESRVYLKYKQWRYLSEQQVVDCSGGKYGNSGCKGGAPSLTYNYWVDVGGVASQNCYPWCGYQQYKCLYNAAQDKTVEVHAGSRSIRAGSEYAIQQYIWRNAPATVQFYFGPDLQHYTGGVYSSAHCYYRPNKVNHSGMIVGWGYDYKARCSYWIVQLSLGTYWGERGYLRILKDSNMCGIADCATYPYGVFMLPNKPTCLPNEAFLQ